jgi:hypothetical protein
MDLFGSLNVNIEKSYQLLFFKLVDLCLFRSIKIGMYLAILNEFITSNLGIESLMIDKVIVLSIDLAFTGLTRCVRDTKTKSVFVLLEHLVH